MKYLSKVFCLALVGSISALCMNANTTSADHETVKTFIVTAYYSPLVGQDHYTTGSYAGDIKLNGSGTHTASGKEVFEGLLAAPRTYGYGTKIYFEGLGVGQVEDRGGAIKNNKIDIWVGYGDEGLRRALIWGSRPVKGYVVSNDTDTSLTMGRAFLKKYNNLQVKPSSDSEDVSKLQELFSEVGLYTGDIDGRYENIKTEIINFQLNHGLIENEKSDDAGYFGKKTRDVFVDHYNFTPIVKESVDIDGTYITKPEPKKLTKEQDIIQDYGNLKVTPESGSDDVKKLQTLFSKLELYDGSINGNYSSVENSLVQFQIQSGIIKDKEGWGAGYYGDQTRSALFEYFGAEDDIEDKREEETIYSLSLKETKQLDTLILKLKREVNKIAKNKNTTSSVVMDQLSERIDTLIDTADEGKLKEKLKYIKQKIA